MKSNAQISIGVGAVVFRGDDVLLIKRGKAPFKGAWSIPGGKLEFGEAVIDAVLREVREETTCEIEIIDLLGVFDALPGQMGTDSPIHTVIIDYVAEWRAGEPIAGDDAEAAEFVSYNNAMDRLSWDTTRTALERARTIRENAQKMLPKST
ncbi:MAG: NUDIX hydrolase [Pseudomonadota bacterium]